jgi:RimK family alpha-L-glutamate ligase
MTQKGLIVVNTYEVFPSVEHMVSRLKEEFAKLGISFDVLSSGELPLWVSEDGKIQHGDLPYDFAIYLDKDPYVASMLEDAGLRLFNKADAIRLCDDKMLTYLSLSDKGIKMPKTIPGPLRYSKKDSDVFLKRIEANFSFPIVVKENYGSLGRNVYLVQNKSELEEFENRLSYSPRLYQELIASSFGVDNRIIVIGGKAIAWMKRKSDNGDFRSNIALGGHGEGVNLPQNYIMMAENCAKILGLDYAGIDILNGPEGEPILCEVNSNAFIKGIEEVTGINVAKAYADYIWREVYQQ